MKTAGAFPKLSDLRRELVQASDPERARNNAWFFKTGKGQYGEGDKFCGISVPIQRRIARRYGHLPLNDLRRLLGSPIHEHRFTALEILVLKYESGDDHARQEVFNFYLANTERINNWDLVDTSAPYIIGNRLLDRSRKVLYRLAKSESVWERRIAIVSTMAFIGHGDLDDTFGITALLLADKHDLIHKAAGWMLREAGKKSERALLAFLKQNYARIPRTMLRYAIERFPIERRRKILQGVF
jgi:3-methyladenine DNA glycosylase AlkD